MASRSVDGRSAGGAVACPHWLATETGRDVLASGGDALAAEIGGACQATGGFLRAGDLAAYEPEWVAPVRAPHRDVEVVTTPPNSQGITALVMLNALLALGADGQPQANVQVLTRALAGATPGEAVAAPRVRHGRFALEDDAEVLQAEDDLGADTIAALRARGHRVVVTPPRDEGMGHAHA